VPLDLADDCRRRIGRELDAAAEVEAVHRLDQADRGDLDEVVVWLAPVAEAPCQVLDEGQVGLDERIAGSLARRVAFLGSLQLDEQRAGAVPVDGQP
jgi:hypothetical protein